MQQDPNLKNNQGGSVPAEPQHDLMAPKVDAAPKDDPSDDRFKVVTTDFVESVAPATTTIKDGEGREQEPSKEGSAPEAGVKEEEDNKPGDDDKGGKQDDKGSGNENKGRKSSFRKAIMREKTRADKLAAENERLKKAQAKESPKDDSGDGEPMLDDYDTLDDWQDAYKEWAKSGDKPGEPKKEADADADITPINTETQRAFEAMRGDLEKKAAEYDGFDEAVRSMSLTEASLIFVSEQENPGDVLWFLSQNKKEADRIAGLSYVGQLEAIDDISDRLSKSPPAKKESNAPNPITPVDGSVASRTKRASEMSLNELRQARQARQAAGGGHWL